MSANVRLKSKSNHTNPSQISSRTALMSLDELKEQKLQNTTALTSAGEVTPQTTDSGSHQEFEADWEKTFIANIESSQTVPFISLFKFKMTKLDIRGIGALNVSKKKGGKESNIYTLKYIKALFGEDINSKRKKKIEEIFDVDDGPFVTDYTSILGLEFWSHFCGIERTLLKKSVPDDFWRNKRDLNLNNNKEKIAQLVDVKRGFCSGIWKTVNDWWEFMSGIYEPIRAPQRVISPDEIFRVKSLADLSKVGDDIIPPKEYRTLKEQIFKIMISVYKMIVDKMGGKWPRIRTPTLEEVYDDMLIWVLDIENARKRVLAIMHDRIKKKII